jgi:hypothetical protein
MLHDSILPLRICFPYEHNQHCSIRGRSTKQHKLRGPFAHTLRPHDKQRREEDPRDRHRHQARCQRFMQSHVQHVSNQEKPTDYRGTDVGHESDPNIGAIRLHSAAFEGGHTWGTSHQNPIPAGCHKGFDTIWQTICFWSNRVETTTRSPACTSNPAQQWLLRIQLRWHVTRASLFGSPC